MATTNGSPLSSSSATISASEANNPGCNPNPNRNLGSSSSNTNQSCWESFSNAQSRIYALSSLLGSPKLIALAESDCPARSLFNSSDAYFAFSAAFSHTSSGSGDDPLCQWLCEACQSSDPDLRLVVLSLVPLLSGFYLSRMVTLSGSFASDSAPALAGFEAVFLALYVTGVKASSCKPHLISVPDLLHPLLYHTPSEGSASAHKPTIGLLSLPLEPQIAVKSTKRAWIVGIALDCYHQRIRRMPPLSKIVFCEFVSSWAGQDCPCRYDFDDDVNFFSSPEMRNCGERASRRCSRVPLPWELMQPVLKILAHCLLVLLVPPEVRDAGSAAIRCVYARASHDITPQVILAARSLIKLDNMIRKTAKGPASNPSTPNKPRRSELDLWIMAESASF
ncbi:uncharacterized protein LOC110025311 [Phalaenopsis equestris]|uniref:uncharacterized protein LOC110025311 n=1 Tax=Phalaenopsis equestris TaxID=78828 RepID=UPI0009E6382D|nr:uncharacterized protein LOC110025311 [Phalaenopsis equestris]